MPRKAAVKMESSAKAVKNLPASESGHGVHYIAKSRKEYCVSSCPEKGRFTLWRIVAGGYEKMASADTPNVLYPIAEDDK